MILRQLQNFVNYNTASIMIHSEIILFTIATPNICMNSIHNVLYASLPLSIDVSL